MDRNSLILGDCMEILPNVEDGSVDMILCDLPYGVTACGWDSILPLETLRIEYERILKPNGTLVLTATQPFTTTLINAFTGDLKFRYSWIWDKGRGSNFQLAKKQPMKCHEDILVFYRKLPTYNPQYWYSTPYKTTEADRTTKIDGLGESSASLHRPATISEDGRRYPLSVIRIPKKKGIHPSQKPIELFEYLVKTYTNPGELVVDNCAGAGTTAIACVNTDRHFICIEKEEKFFEFARNSLDKILLKF